MSPGRTSSIVTRVGAGAGPRPNDPPERHQRIFRREDDIKGQRGDEDEQEVAEPHDPRAIDGGFAVCVGQVGGGAILQRPIDHRRHLLTMVSEQEEIDQAVFQRRAALFDRLRGKDRIDAAEQRRQDAKDAIRAPARGEPQQQQQPCGKPQPAGHHPMVQGGGEHQVGKYSRGQRHQSAGDVDALQVAAGLPQPLVDEGFTRNRRRALRSSRRRRSDDSTGHDLPREFLSRFAASPIAPSDRGSSDGEASVPRRDGENPSRGEFCSSLYYRRSRRNPISGFLELFRMSLSITRWGLSDHRYQVPLSLRERDRVGEAGAARTSEGERFGRSPLTPTLSRRERGTDGVPHSDSFPCRVASSPWVFIASLIWYF